jgi:hypothetical protein
MKGGITMRKIGLMLIVLASMLFGFSSVMNKITNVNNTNAFLDGTTFDNPDELGFPIGLM